MRANMRRIISVSAAGVAAASLVLAQSGLADAELPARYYFTSNSSNITAHVTAGPTDVQGCKINEINLGILGSASIPAGVSGTVVTPTLPSGPHDVELWCNTTMVKKETVSVPPGPMDQLRDTMEGFGS